MPNKDIDPNTLHILRELSERKRLNAQTRLNPPPLSPDDARNLHRFDIMPANAISKHDEARGEDNDEEDDDKKKKKDKKKKDGKKKGAVSGENYLHLYMEQQKHTREEQLQMAEKARSELSSQTQNQIQKQKEDQQRIRAKQLQEQILYWKQQVGQGQYDDSAIAGILSTLEFELNGIPANFW